MTIIRELKLTDLDDIKRFAPMMHQESEVFKHHDMDPFYVEQFVGHLMSMPNGISIAAEADGHVVGVMIGIVVPHWFSLSSTMAYDLGLFVDPNYRGSFTVIRLLKEYVNRARKLGADHVMIINSAGFNQDRILPIYEKMGFEKVGAVFDMRFD